MLSSQLLSAPQSHSSSQYSGWDKKEVSRVGSILHSWGNRVLTLMLSLTNPGGDIAGWEGVSRHWATPPWRRGDAGKVKLLPLPPSMCPNLRYFCSNSVLVLLRWTPRLPHSHSHPQVSVKLLFFESKIVENSSSAISTTSLRTLVLMGQSRRQPKCPPKENR